MSRLIWVGVGIFLAFAMAYCSLKTAKPRAPSVKPPVSSIVGLPDWR